MSIFGRCNPKLGSKTYGILPGRGMGYGLLRTYGLWGEIPRPPRWWTQKCMGFRRLWVMASMGYEGADCTRMPGFHERTHRLPGFNIFRCFEVLSGFRRLPGLRNPWKLICSITDGLSFIQLFYPWKVIYFMKCFRNRHFSSVELVKPDGKNVDIHLKVPQSHTSVFFFCRVPPRQLHPA